MSVNCVFVTFPLGILGQVWYLIVSIPDLCPFLTFIYVHFFYQFKRRLQIWKLAYLEFGKLILFIYNTGSDCKNLKTVMKFDIF